MTNIKNATLKFSIDVVHEEQVNVSMELLVYALQNALHVKTFMWPVGAGVNYGDMLSRICDRCLGTNLTP